MKLMEGAQKKFGYACKLCGGDYVYSSRSSVPGTVCANLDCEGMSGTMVPVSVAQDDALARRHEERSGSFGAEITPDTFDAPEFIQDVIGVGLTEWQAEILRNPEMLDRYRWENGQRLHLRPSELVEHVHTIGSEPLTFVGEPEPTVIFHQRSPHQNVLLALPEDAAERKATPIATGVLDYFPAAIAEVARISKAGNDQHNPGQPMHWARGKSSDHADCIVRHLLQRGTTDTDGVRHAAKLAWRALALLQEEIEAAAGFNPTEGS